MEWWGRRRMPAPSRRLDVPVPPRMPARNMSGPYVLLHTYLDNRFADTVVLTFAQVEDIVGFPLPEQALLQPEWWTGASTGSAHHSDSWTLARRTAVPNLGAKIVSFARAY
ncbi:MAG: hypothetical protein JWL71_282 [Acidobacteria bacterium]|nr:hypothetical protein [Acidobacteriota bacterium]